MLRSAVTGTWRVGAGQTGLESSCYSLPFLVGSFLLSQSRCFALHLSSLGHLFLLASSPLPSSLPPFFSPFSSAQPCCAARFSPLLQPEPTSFHLVSATGNTHSPPFLRTRTVPLNLKVHRGFLNDDKSSPFFRGASEQWPENSIISMAQAVKDGADGLEGGKAFLSSFKKKKSSWTIETLPE